MYDIFSEAIHSGCVNPDETDIHNPTDDGKTAAVFMASSSLFSFLAPYFVNRCGSERKFMENVCMRAPTFHFVTCLSVMGEEIDNEFLGRATRKIDLLQTLVVRRASIDDGIVDYLINERLHTVDRLYLSDFAPGTGVSAEGMLKIFKAKHLSEALRTCIAQQLQTMVDGALTSKARCAKAGWLRAIVDDCLSVRTTRNSIALFHAAGVSAFSRIVRTNSEVTVAMVLESGFLDHLTDWLLHSVDTNDDLFYNSIWACDAMAQNRWDFCQLMLRHRNAAILKILLDVLRKHTDERNIMIMAARCIGRFLLLARANNGWDEISWMFNTQQEGEDFISILEGLCETNETESIDPAETYNNDSSAKKSTKSNNKNSLKIAWDDLFANMLFIERIKCSKLIEHSKMASIMKYVCADARRALADGAKGNDVATIVAFEYIQQKDAWLLNIDEDDEEDPRRSMKDFQSSSSNTTMPNSSSSSATEDAAEQHAEKYRRLAFRLGDKLEQLINNGGADAVRFVVDYLRECCRKFDEIRERKVNESAAKAAVKAAANAAVKSAQAIVAQVTATAAAASAVVVEGEKQQKSSVDAALEEEGQDFSSNVGEGDDDKKDGDDDDDDDDFAGNNNDDDNDDDDATGQEEQEDEEDAGAWDITDELPVDFALACTALDDVLTLSCATITQPVIPIVREHWPDIETALSRVINEPRYVPPAQLRSIAETLRAYRRA